MDSQDFLGRRTRGSGNNKFITKKCKKCQKIKDLKFFSDNKKGENGKRAICQKCTRQKQKQRVLEIRFRIFSHYGPCKNCNISDIDLLTIDHINNDGAIKRKRKEHSRGYHFYEWIKKNNFPNYLQSLCWNCQHKKKILYEKTMAEKRD